jgi:cysteine synthase B
MGKRETAVPRWICDRPTRAAADSLLGAIGHTPLLELDLVREVAAGTRLFAKLEACNPGGSIKDRPVARMLTRGMRQGRLASRRRLLDSSSGNAGISYAMLGAAFGVPVTLVVPGNASRERLAHSRPRCRADPHRPSRGIRPDRRGL